MNTQERKNLTVREAQRAYDTIALLDLTPSPESRRVLQTTFETLTRGENCDITAVTSLLLASMKLDEAQAALRERHPYLFENTTRYL